MRKLRIGPRHANLRIQRGSLLHLNRTVDADQNLTLLNPITSIDINLRNRAAFTNDANWDFATSRKRSGSVYRANDGIAAGCDHGYRLRLSVLGFACGRRSFATVRTSAPSSLRMC